MGAWGCRLGARGCSPDDGVLMRPQAWGGWGGVVAWWQACSCVAARRRWAGARSTKVTRVRSGAGSAQPYSAPRVRQAG